MERPNSAILSGIEQATKKVRNKELEEDILGDLAMEDVVLGKVSFNDKLMANMNPVALEPIGSFQVIDTENDYFLVKFSMNQDYNKALTEEKCSEFVKDINLPYSILNESRPSPPKVKNMVVGHSGFAPWMQATGRKCRSVKQIGIKKYVKSIVVEKATSKNTRFNILADMEEPDIGESSRSQTEKMDKFTKNVNGRKIEKGKGLQFKEGAIVKIMELTKTKEVAAKQTGNETIEVG
ncbi:hypothetical protein GOBAR_AA18585 [Gossypium barbadense]|uniref:DUF4283 domain-containing protein n=1 Tax=Gossypium barbadense TaxID=3634 RepID=A0A2P5XFH6_GOSBA|nr:hypothetical protein GOBAR_AA18585 [Gossypium barbadense]